MKIICTKCKTENDLKEVLVDLPKEFGMKMGHEWRGDLKGKESFRIQAEKLGWIFGFTIFNIRQCPYCPVITPIVKEEICVSINT